jgi:hypothetical protein
MFRQTALLLSMLVHTFVSPAFPHVQASPAGTGEHSPSATTCRELSFSGRINGDEGFSRELGGKLWVRFVPTKDKSGWIVSVGPADNANGRFGDWPDYAWPVNPPLRGDNSQYLSTGYGDTVEYRLKYEHRIFFVLDHANYDQAVKLVNDEAFSKNVDGAARYFAALPKIPAAILDLKPIRFEVANEGKSVNWMEYSVTAIVPASFEPAAGLSRKERPCPPMHWGS